VDYTLAVHLNSPNLSISSVTGMKPLNTSEPVYFVTGILSQFPGEYYQE